MKGIPVPDEYIKVLSQENRKNLTVNHEDALKSIQNRTGHVFGPLLQLWFIMGVKKEETLADLKRQG